MWETIIGFFILACIFVRLGFVLIKMSAHDRIP